MLRACRTGRRTVLVTAANAGLVPLFCGEHVYREVIEHSGDWTAEGPVARDAFLRRWLLEYLPLIRVVPMGEGHLAWLAPAELARDPAARRARPGSRPVHRSLAGRWQAGQAAPALLHYLNLPAALPGTA